MNEFIELLLRYSERVYDRSVMVDYLRRELAPMLNVDEESMIDPTTNQLYPYYGFITYQEGE